MESRPSSTRPDGEISPFGMDRDHPGFCASLAGCGGHPSERSTWGWHPFPGTGRAAHAPVSTLLRVGFTEPTGSPRSLVRSYRTVSPLPVCDPRATPSAVSFLWHCPAGRPDWPLASTLPCGVPTFLDPQRHGASTSSEQVAATRPALSTLFRGLGGHPSERSTWETYSRRSTGRAVPPPVRPCSGWGLPSRSGRPDRWCALTAPFHPYLCDTRGCHHRRSVLCGTFLQVAPTGR